MWGAGQRAKTHAIFAKNAENAKQKGAKCPKSPRETKRMAFTMHLFISLLYFCTSYLCVITFLCALLFRALQGAATFKP